MQLDTLRMIARRAADVFGNTPTVNRYSHEGSDLRVDILRSPDSPEPGLTSYATIGMSSFETHRSTPAGELRVELVGVARPEWTAMPSGLATAAFNVGTGEYSIKIGAAYPEVFAGYRQGVTTPHAFFWHPFVWSRSFDELAAEGATITWLMAIPITDSEMEFIRLQGANAFVDELDRQTPDIYDMGRAGIEMGRHEPAQERGDRPR